MPARRLLLLACLVAFSGCASSPPPVRSEVETFHRLADRDLTRTLAIVPGDASKAGSLEFEAYAAMVANGLARQGFRVVPIDQEPELVALFDYAIDQGRDQVFSFAVPQFGQTGIAASHTMGMVHGYGSGATYSGTTTYTPSYGITGYTPYLGTRRVHRRAAVLHIYDLAQGREPMRLYESIATSEGREGNLAEVMGAIVGALFSDFLATGARTVTVTGG